MQKIIKNCEKYLWLDLYGYEFLDSEENHEEVSEEELKKLNIIVDIDDLHDYDELHDDDNKYTNYLIIDCYSLVEVDEDGEEDVIKVIGYNSDSAKFLRRKNNDSRSFFR